MWRRKRNYSFFAARKKKNERVCDQLQKLEREKRKQKQKKIQRVMERDTNKEKQRDGKRNYINKERKKWNKKQRQRVM